MLGIQDLSVATVAAIIAAVVFVIQFIIPILIPLILVGSLSDTNSAVSWSVVGRLLHSSIWPTLLNSDTAAIVGVQRRVNLISIFQKILLMLVAVAAVVTPLGLYEVIAEQKTSTNMSFQYVQDPSPMGYGTPPRSELGFNRECGFAFLTRCPWTDNNITIIRNETSITTEMPNGYDLRIPRNMTQFFSSGLETMMGSVSSFFDIQWRNYEITEREIFNNGSEYVVGKYRPLASLILDDSIAAIEGLVVDTKSGGVGFRNHSVPPSLKYGGTWSEDLLFIQPETECVDTNLTLEFTIPTEAESIFGPLKNFSLVDQGGFANFDKQLPVYDYNDTQAYPNLRDRAYFGAVYNNIFSMLFLNVTNRGADRFRYLDSFVGKRFGLGNGSETVVTYDALVTDYTYGNFLPVPGSSNFSNELNSTLALFPNPLNISASNFSAIADGCRWDGGVTQLANISAIAVQCGMLLGAARPADDTASLIFAPNSKWTMPIYSCASASKASIKTATFRYVGNTTTDFQAMSILDLKDKTYSNDASKPLWAVEDTTDRIIDEVPVWGLVADQYSDFPGVSTLRKEHLWLPGTTTLNRANNFQNLPGGDFYRNALYAAYSSSGRATGEEQLADYSGKATFAMYAKWQELSREPSTAARILNLIWTDVAANTVIGTRGWMGSEKYRNVAKREDADAPVSLDGSLVPVFLSVRQVRYHLQYAIPAFIVLFLLTMVIVSSLIMVLLGRTKMEKMRKFLNSTSAGRIMTNFLYPADFNANANQKQWHYMAGRKHVQVGGQFPIAKDGPNAAQMYEYVPPPPPFGPTLQGHTGYERVKFAEDDVSNGQTTLKR